MVAGAAVLWVLLPKSAMVPFPTMLAAYVLASAINAAAELRRWVPGITPDNVERLYARPALLGLLCADG